MRAQSFDNKMKDRTALSAIGLVSLVVFVIVGFLLLGRQRAIHAGYDVSVLPALNAFLSGTSAIFLISGYLFIRRKKVTAHKTCMLTAFGVSSLFLVSYVIYHYHAGSTPFRESGLIRVIYFTLLISHVALAMSIIPLALTTVYLAWTRQFVRHKRIARWTFPLWLYVSVTGVLIYWMLYHLSPWP
jgi:putative membrane protein